jgi:hypothetical protein
MVRLVWVQAWKAREAVTVNARQIHSRSGLPMLGAGFNGACLPSPARYLERNDCWTSITAISASARSPHAPASRSTSINGARIADCTLPPAMGSGRKGPHRHSTLARADFEKAWQRPRCTDADLVQNRRERAFTAWKYKMWDSNHRLPTQIASGPSKCFCGAALAIPGVADLVYQAHMDMA